MSDSSYLMAQEEGKCTKCIDGTMSHQELWEAIEILVDANKDGLINNKQHLNSIVLDLMYSNSPCLWCDGRGNLN